MGEIAVRTEMYHTLDEFVAQGLKPLQLHIFNYFHGDKTIPVVKSKISLLGVEKDLFLTFSDGLLKTFLEDESRIIKPYETAIKYGFRGYSKGKQNGIFYQRDITDKNMMNATDSFMQKYLDAIEQDLFVCRTRIDSLRNVKIVWHKPCGERVVGAYNTQLSRILFLGFAKY